MTATVDEADYLGPGSRVTRQRPAWLRLGLPIAATWIVALGGATGIGFLSEKRYEAAVQVELITPPGADLENMPLPPARIGAARSVEVASEAVTALELTSDRRFLADNPSVAADGLSEADRVTRASSALMNAVEVGIDGDSPIARLTYRSSSPDLAAEIATALGQAFVAEDANRVTGALDQSRAELEALVEQIGGELEASERSLTSGMSEADILALPPSEAELVATPGADALTEEARIAMSGELSVVRANIDRLEAQIASGEMDENDPVIARLLQSRAGLEEEYQRLTEQFRADYPAARQLRTQIEGIDQTLARESLRLAEDRAREQAQLTRREMELIAQLSALGAEVGQRSAAGEGLGDLQQQVGEKRALYDLLLARLAQAEEGERLTTARLLGTAAVPTSPVVPNWYWLLGGAVGIALLLTLALLAWDTRRRRKLY